MLSCSAVNYCMLNKSLIPPDQPRAADERSNSGEGKKQNFAGLDFYLHLIILGEFHM